MPSVVENRQIDPAEPLRVGKQPVSDVVGDIGAALTRTGLLMMILFPFAFPAIALTLVVAALLLVPAAVVAVPVALVVTVRRHFTEGRTR
jgi:hypothetical protein